MVRNKLRILFLTGSHPRHQYISRKLDKTGKLIGIICQKRESLVPKSPENRKIEAKALFELHFKKREESENKFFGEALWPDLPIMEIEKSQQNSKEVLDKIKMI